MPAQISAAAGSPISSDPVMPIVATISGACHGFIVLPFCVFVVYSRFVVVCGLVIRLLFV